MNAPSSGRLGRYHLFESLGGGPTGEVFRGQVYGASAATQQYAVKRFHPALVADPRAATALAAAARTYAALEHPRIATLHEFGEDGASTFAVTEYVPGLDLGRLLAQNQLSLGAAARLIIQAGRALGYAHGRGVFHLGLAPTNIICSERGGIKVTDFGMLPPRLSSRPAEDSSLAQRLCYLAPEQLEGRSTGPATDVYQLGIIAYELMTHRKPYVAANPGELAQKMLRAPPPDSGLPVPYEKLLQRALARSSFERFSDAGAMADALEAALRTSPQTGSVADVGAAVSARLHGPSSATPEQRTTEQVVEMVATPPPLLQGPGASTRTILGQSPLVSPTVSPNVLPRLARAPSAAETVPDLAGAAIADLDAGLELGPAGTDTSVAPGTLLGGVASEYIQHDSHGFADDAPTVVQESSELGNLVQESVAPRRLDSVLGELLPPAAAAPAPAPVTAAPPMSTMPRRPSELPLPASPEKPRAEVFTGTKSLSISHKRSGSRIPLLLLGCAVLGVGGYLGYQALQDDHSKPGEQVAAAEPVVEAKPVVPAKPPVAELEAAPTAPVPIVPAEATQDATPAVITDAEQITDAANNAAPDAAIVAVTTSDAARPQPEDPTTPVQPASDALRIESTPQGAKVYLDGAMVGTTPVDLDASPDRHRLALLLAGHDLHTGDIDGTGLTQIDLKEVTPPGGPAGIKVRCRKKNRYYVYVDGNPVGQLCPSERIGVAKGKHIVEIYDPLTDSRRSFSVKVKDTRLSVRVKVD